MSTYVYINKCLYVNYIGFICQQQAVSVLTSPNKDEIGLSALAC